MADDYDIPSRTSFRTEVVRAEWDDASARWTVHLKNLDNGAEYTHECKILFSASGVLVNPKTPVIPGQDRFRGPQIHSARWDHSVSLAGKNVAIIGNGCKKTSTVSTTEARLTPPRAGTGTQILSAIAPEAASITQFARSKHWIKAENNTVVTPTAKWALQNIPLMQSLLRFAIYCTAEWDYRLQTVGWFGDHERAKKMKDVGSLMRKTAPKKFHDLLIPEFTIMCKRVVQGLEYLEALNLPNVTLTDEAIIEITETGILAGSTNYPVDVIVYATGFYTDNVVSPSELLGRDGKKLQQLWIERGGDRKSVV